MPSASSSPLFLSTLPTTPWRHGGTSPPQIHLKSTPEHLHASAALRLPTPKESTADRTQSPSAAAAGNGGGGGAWRRLPAALRRGDGVVQRARPQRGGARQLVARPAAPGAVVDAQHGRRLPPLLPLGLPLVLRHLLLEAQRLHPQRSRPLSLPSRRCCCSRSRRFVLTTIWVCLARGFDSRVYLWGVDSRGFRQCR